MATKDLHIGCAGWGISSAHAEFFPGDGTHLQRYARRFEMVEINSSFYRPHQPKTYAKWAACVPDGFRFAVKFPRAATHDARLHAPVDIIETFLSQVRELGDRLGPILVQLPPSLAFELDVASAFFDALRTRFDGAIVCEPRHATWFEAQVDAFWTRFEVSRVAADPARFPEAAKAGGAGGLRYWRLHGSPRIYYDAYGEEGLQPWADDIAAARYEGLHCWVVMDNTALGHATFDALRLEAMLDGESPRG
ncbi:DUF72 domain-containing protein [Lysobacter sp. HA18]